MTARNKLLFSFLCLLIAGGSAAQSFSVRAPLSAVQKTGFYRIPVTPDLSARSALTFSDVRILDEAGRQVPYIIRPVRKEAGAPVFMEFPILEQRTGDSVTILELENTGAKGIGEISLVIANNAVERYTSLSGSDDRRQWFILDEQIPLRRNVPAAGDRFVQSVRFPLTHYRYFRLLIRNAQTDPLRILSAGRYAADTSAGGPEWRNNPPGAFTQRDSNGHTIVDFRQQAPFLTERLSVQLSGAPYYQRTVMVFADSVTVSGKSVSRLSAGFALSSARPAVWELPVLKADRLTLDIDNGDNPPLRVTEVQTSQQARYLVTWLEAGQQYALVTGDPKARTPVYDLAQFSDSIPAVLPELSYGPLTIDKTAQQRGEGDRPSNNWIWAVIVLVVVVLGFMTYKMVGEMRDQSE